MKKFLSGALALTLTLSLATTAFAAVPAVKINGTAPTAIAQAFINSDNRTMVPLSYFEKAGVRVAWNDQLQEITLVSSTKVVVATIGKTTIKVDGKDSSVAAQPALVSNVPFLPLRAFSDLFGMSITWENATSTANLSSTLTLPTATNKTLLLATTTSTKDSGLLDVLLPVFTKATGIEVKVSSVGTGAALKQGSDGEADAMLVHSKAAELEGMKAGDGIGRQEIMYNDFIIIGPAADPANVKSANNKVTEALKAIDKASAIFISRGDKSGTDNKDKAIWKTAGITPNPKTYMEAASGMLATLTIADEKGAYTLTDRATYLANKDKFDLVVVCEGDKGLLNQYSVMPVNPNKNDKINVVAAMQFAEFLTSNEAQDVINSFGVKEYGAPLFFFNYKSSY